MRGQNWLLEVIVLSVIAVLVCLSMPTENAHFMLPQSLNPEHYEISLSPLLDKNIFQGVVVIRGVALVETQTIVLHCRSLVFNSTSLTDLEDDEEVEVEDIVEDKDQQQCLLSLNQTLKIDHEYRLTMEFLGIIGKEGVGLYRDFYYEEGVKHELLMTHFQPNYARAMFPCFDEPHYKAQFLLRVSRQGFPTVISNMPATPSSPPPTTITHNPEESLEWVEFEETPPMSSYLLVLVMCDYISLSDSDTNSSVWAPRSRLHEAQLALNFSVAVLDQCDSYFGTKHVLPKLDHIPVPTLNTVAMENWGAITYKKDFLLWEEGVSTWAQRETVAYVICHEIVHQWVGNLVTTTWWNTTWLNEGVTSFFHYYFIDKIEPSWNVMDTMFVTQIQLIFNEEAKRDPKPLTNNRPFTSQDSIASDAFSAVTYIKGAAIMRMVHSLMEPDTFREAIVQYVMDNEYDSVDEEDLWQSVAAVADLPVDLESVMHSWTHQAGYPLVTVLRGSDGCITLTQDKYSSEDKETRWTIPVTYTTSSELDFNSSRVVWFPEGEDQLQLPGVCLQEDEWIILNIRQMGFYRVNYDLETWQGLATTLVRGDLSVIHPVNRGQLLYDSFDLALHGVWPFYNPLGLSRFLRRETEYLPWFIGVEWFNVLKAHLYSTDCFPLYRRFVLSVVNDSFHSIQMSGDAGGLLKELHRKQIVEFACEFGHPGCVKEATNTIYLLMSGVYVNVPLDLKPVLLCSAVEYGQDEVWHFVLKEYLAAAENERWKYLNALACTRKRDTVQRLLKDVANPSSFVKTNEERLTLLMEIGKQEDTLEPILDLIIDHFDALSSNFNMEILLNLLRMFIDRMPTTQEKLKIIKLSSMVSGDAKQNEIMMTTLDDIRKLNFNSMYKRVIERWLQDELQGTEETTTITPTSSINHTTTDNIDSENEITEGNQRNHIEGGDKDLNGSEEDDEEEENDEPNIVSNSDPNNSTNLGIRVQVTPILLLFILFISMSLLRL